MRIIPLSLTVLSLLILTACGQTTVTGPFVEPDETWPEDCRNQGYFPEEFPLDVVYPASVPLGGYEMDSDYDEALIGTFCTKDTAKNIVDWYRNTFEPQGYEYSTIETVHYLKSPHQTIFLDIVKELGSFVQYSVDVRWSG